LPFADLLPEAEVQQLADEEGLHFAQADHHVYSPAVTLGAWLSQCLSANKSCVAAVARVLVLRASLALPPCSAGTGAYCKARAKLSERFLQRLTLQVGVRLEQQADPSWRWHDRRVLLADGAECSLPDTEANQLVYPQPTSQKKGLGFPLIRLVVLLTFATAGLVGCAMGPHSGKETGETALFRQLLDDLLAGDVVVADRYYCSYWMLAALSDRGVDACFRLHQRRKYDFTQGKRLSQDDHIVTWNKPARPEWMDEASYAAVQETLTIREVRFQIHQPGYRSQEIVVATTLTDAKAYSQADLAELYHQRWHVELDLRAIKQTLKMEILACKTPEGVRKEIWTHLLGYNLVRQAMAQAARQSKIKPRQVSFAGAVQTLEAFRLALSGSRGAEWLRLEQTVIRAIGTHQVGDRPGRCEPRKVKRRPKGYARMTRPRGEERTRILRGESN